MSGQELPTDRAGLYDLVGQWVLNTHKGKRAGHGLLTWGKINARNNTEAEPTSDDEPKTAGGETPKRWRIIGADYLKVSSLIAGYLDETPTAKGLRFKVDVGDMLKFLDAAGVDYAIDGALPENVTLSVCESSETYIKCDTGEGIGEKKPAKPLDFSALEGARGVWR